ncbi:MAG: hypothetical protein J0I36_18125, partial [Pandoraea sp.]|nr:hypothetical protein [Pandoraea sp.]
MTDYDVSPTDAVARQYDPVPSGDIPMSCRFASVSACFVVSIAEFDEGATIKMTVSNDGDPISEANRERIFDA